MFESTASSLIDPVIDGYVSTTNSGHPLRAAQNGAFFAYGQSGGGKTHSMVGGDVGDSHSMCGPMRGLIPRAVEQLFSRLNQVPIERASPAPTQAPL